MSNHASLAKSPSSFVTINLSNQKEKCEYLHETKIRFQFRHTSPSGTDCLVNSIYNERMNFVKNRQISLFQTTQISSLYFTLFQLQSNIKHKKHEKLLRNDHLVWSSTFDRVRVNVFVRQANSIQHSTHTGKNIENFPNMS